MKVYIVVYFNTSMDTDIEEVFSTENAALEYIRQRYVKFTEHPYVDTNGSFFKDASGKRFVHVETWEVKS